MITQTCILDHPGGSLTLDLELIGWLRKFHKRIAPFMHFTKPRCEAFKSLHCILWCLSVPFLFHFLQNTRLHVTGGRQHQGCIRPITVHIRWVTKHKTSHVQNILHTKYCLKISQRCFLFEHQNILTMKQ